MREFIENRTFAEINVGDSATLKRVLTRADIQLFAVTSGDANPAHLDDDYARQDRFHEIIAHGMWGGALISSLLGMRLPGPGTIYLEQSLRFRRPVKVGDAVRVTVRVAEKDAARRTLRLECRAVNQDGHEVINGEALVLAPEKKVRRPLTRLPKVRLSDEPNRVFDDLAARVAELPPLPVAVAHPVDENSLGGALAAARAGVIVPILVGPREKIEFAASDCGLDLAGLRIENVPHSHAAAARCAELAAAGAARAVMKGALSTAEFMAALLRADAGLRAARRASHVSLMDVPGHHKPILLTDAAVHVRPTLADKRDIVQNAIDLFRALGRGTPKVALVAAVEKVSETMRSTLDAAALCKMAERGQITGGLLDGPLGLDCAISPEAARVKNIASRVAGAADILVAPDIESGNMVYKQMRYLFHVEGAGVVVGLRVPAILTSRAAGPGPTRVASCAMAALLDQFNRAGATQWAPPENNGNGNGNDDKVDGKVDDKVDGRADDRSNGHSNNGRSNKKQ